MSRRRSKRKTIERILDNEAIVSPQLLELARWISQYYLAPLGEVLRTMLPLVAEVRRQVVYRIAEAGERALQQGAEQGSTAARAAPPKSRRRSMPCSIICWAAKPQSVRR